MLVPGSTGATPLFSSQKKMQIESGHRHHVGASFVSLAPTFFKSQSARTPLLLLFSRDPLTLGSRLMMRAVGFELLNCTKKPDPSKGGRAFILFMLTECRSTDRSHTPSDPAAVHSGVPSGCVYPGASLRHPDPSHRASSGNPGAIGHIRPAVPGEYRS